MKLYNSSVFRRVVALAAAVALGCSCGTPLYARQDPVPRSSPPPPPPAVKPGRPTLPVVDPMQLPGVNVPGPHGKPVPAPPPRPPGPPVVNHRPPGPSMPMVNHRPPGPPAIGPGPVPPFRPAPPPHYRDRHWERRHEPPRPRHYGRFYQVLPPAAFPFFLGGVSFYYSSGRYFRPAPNGYIVVEAPIGARIRVLPDRCSYFYYRGDRCYACDEVFYREVGTEYVVIERPVRWDDVVHVGDYVRVTTDALNVRSGPGTDHDVIGQVFAGDIVEVNGIEDGWFHIEFDRGSYGWVMQQYTVPYEINANSKG